ncbi:PREDICTED: multiple organellar RNA editing factor 8, chloroplastic/mitochondrial [Tarenaya hassleriana]|uniref:multiple organellar RNA editing factor 8, chloroplastic/mitochondrial n=1 Tax=Tarenaya hassleriana TaxID=28532 RepID=UPI00053C89BB|nr:PREDICTED: multiple organellar RNA editing factor 8, chloroplastic/mitochondrial [Tarenaya hassleriana]
MASRTLSRSTLSQRAKSLSILFARSFSSSPSLAKTPVPSFAASSLLSRSRPLAAALSSVIRGVGVASTRGLSTRATSSSLNDPNPNWSNRPPKETILLDGCDFEHWLIVMEKPEGDPTRDEIIDYYIKTLAQIVGSEEEARMKIYSVSTRCYYAFGALVPEELSLKIKELPKVRWVLPDSYLDVKNKDYGGEPFIDGKAVPYDPKYHEEWIRNNARANERNRRNDRPRNADRSRNFERRRENVRGNQGPNAGSAPPPPPNMGGSPPPPNMGGMPPNMGGGPNMAPPNMGGGMQGNMGQHMPPPNMNQNYMGGGGPPNAGWSGNVPPGNFQPNNGYPGQGGNIPPGGNFQQNSGFPGQGGMQNPQYQNAYPPNRDGRNPYEG